MYSRIFLIFFLFSFFYCSFDNDNPLDESGINYVPPAIYIDSVSVANGDTIRGNTALLALSGNAPESQFRVRVRDGEWSPWFDAGSYELGSLSEGFQIIELCGRYEGGENYTYDSIAIYVLKNLKDTTLIDTLSISDTITIIDTISLSDSVRVSYTIKVSDIVMVMDTLNFPNTGIGTSGKIDTVKISDTIRISDTVRIIDTIKIINKEDSIDTVKISDTIKIIDTVKIINGGGTPEVNTFFYNVVYDGNLSDGGDIPIDTNKYEEGAIIIIKEDEPQLELQKFIGWKNPAQDILKIYFGGDTLIMGKSDIILEAQWESIPSFLIEFKCDDCTSSLLPPPFFVKEGENYIIPLYILVKKEGSKFIYWSTKKNGKGTSYNPGDVIKVEGNIVLYAEWEKEKNSLNFHCDDCEGGSLDKLEIVCDSIITFDSVNIWKTGYLFKEWNISADGEGKGYKIGDTLIASDKYIELYAQWDDPMGMVMIPSKNKTFQMGGAMFEIEWPLRMVKLTKNIWFDTVEVTRKNFSSIMEQVYPGMYLSSLSRDEENYPVVNVNWYGAILYCNALTRLTKSTDTVYSYTSREYSSFEGFIVGNVTINLDKKGFRLPSEAEWEFSARGGSEWFSLNEDEISKIAWYRNNSGEEVRKVAGKNSNGYHLYDMIGNVSEWTNDWYYRYEVDTTKKEIFIDPINIKSNLEVDKGRIHRGGNVSYESNRASWSFREYTLPNVSDKYLGFRCCLPIN